MSELQRLYIGGDVEWSDRCQRQVAVFAPGEELVASPDIGATRVRVADVRGEEVDVAPAGRVAGVRDQCRHYVGVGRAGEHAGLDNRGELVGRVGHGPSSTPILPHDNVLL